jgi:tRNA pseudouridine55 synthase
LGEPGPYGVIGPDGTALAVMSDRDGKGRPEVVFAGED